MGKEKLPWGSIIKRDDRGGLYYWQYFNRDRGKTLRISTKTTNRKEALRTARLLASQYLAMRDGHLPGEEAGDGVLLSAAYEKYFQSSVSRIGEKYLKEIARFYDAYFDPFFGDVGIESITASRIAEFGNWLIGRGLAPQTANKVISSLSKTLKFAARNGWLHSIPYIQRLPERQAEHGYELSDDEIGRLLAATDESPEHVRRFVVLCLYCGLRHGEAAAVQWEDIDWRRGIIRVIQKNRSEMPAPLGKAREILAEVAESDRRGPIVEYHDIITGERRGIKSMRRAWKTVRRRAGIPEGVRIHDMRHTFVSRVFRLLGYDARFLSRHKSQEAFIKYLHAERDQVLQKAAEAF